MQDIEKRNYATLSRKQFQVKFDLSNTPYTAIENIGTGAYGVVCSAVHNVSGDKVAIKKILNIFDHEIVAKRTYREIKILKHFKHDNIIFIREILKPSAQLQDVYIVLDLMESDLHHIIHSTQELSQEHIRFFLYQILRGLKYIHSANVIHRDLKPSNLLVNENCELKIGDFGMARGISSCLQSDTFSPMTQYVATRWYRAPELMLGNKMYSGAVDVWSVGCIFAEMLGRKHLFPGKNYREQLHMIFGILGTPPPSLVEHCSLESLSGFIAGLGTKEAVPLTQLFPSASKKVINLLGMMLKCEPVHRINVDDALKHLYLSKYHDPEDEPVCIPVFNFDFEKKRMSMDDLRDAISEEITPPLEGAAKLEELDLKPVPPNELTRNSSFRNSANSQPLRPTCSSPALQAIIHGPDGATPVGLLTANVKAAGNGRSQDVIMLSASRCGPDAPMKSAGLEQWNSLMPGKDFGMAEESQEIMSLIPKRASDVLEAEGVDTKAKIKEAILNARKRKEIMEKANKASVNDDGSDLAPVHGLSDTSFGGEFRKPEEKTRPVTAAQRQKEREKKRKEKKDKALERQKKKEAKNPKKKIAGEILTAEDHKLMDRWKEMTNAAKSNIGSQVAQVRETGDQDLQRQKHLITPLSNLSNFALQLSSQNIPAHLVSLIQAPAADQPNFLFRCSPLMNTSRQQQLIAPKPVIRPLPVQSQAQSSFTLLPLMQPPLQQPAAQQPLSLSHNSHLSFNSTPRDVPQLVRYSTAGGIFIPHNDICVSSTAPSSIFIPDETSRPDILTPNRHPYEKPSSEIEYLLDTVELAGIHNGSEKGSDIPKLSPISLIMSQKSTPPVLSRQLTSSSTETSLSSALPTDWLSQLSRKLDKSHVQDMQMTNAPKGTGDGYGVGTDLDMLMEESDRGFGDSAPLSSLIADWMSITAPIDPGTFDDMIEKEFNSPSIYSGLHTCD